VRIQIGAKELIELGRRQCPKGKILRKGYTTKRGVRVGPACVKDVGAPGKAPASKRWLPELGPRPLGRWSKRLPASVRHASLVQKTAERGCLRVLRDLNALANVTRDQTTKQLMRQDYRWLRAQGVCHLKTKKD
jgi:hypothetical protein